MMEKPDQILAGISRFMSLQDGDIIMTGTTKGGGQVTAGDSFFDRVKSGQQLLISRDRFAR